MSEFSKKLAKIKANWKKGQEIMSEAPTFSRLGPGRYKGRVSDAEVNESQKGRLQAFIQLTATEGESKGDDIRKYYGLDKPEGIAALCRDVVRLGQESPEDPEEIESLLENMAKTKVACSFQVKESGEYMNVFINKVLSDEEVEGIEESSGEEAAAEEAPAEESAPAEEAAPAEAEAPPADEEVAIGPGLRVIVSGKGEGEVVKVDEDKGEIAVKLDTGKTVIVGVDKLELAPTKPKVKKPLLVKRK